jgi:hypothetical protein
MANRLFFCTAHLVHDSGGEVAGGFDWSQPAERSERLAFRHECFTASLALRNVLLDSGVRRGFQRLQLILAQQRADSATFSRHIRHFVVS